METLRMYIEFGATSIEALAITMIVGAFFYATIRFILHTGRHAPKPYDRYKAFLGRSLMLGLEFLVAADVIRTVGVAPTFQNIAILGAIILVRTFLSWSLDVELEGRWPWQPEPGPRSE